VAFATAFLTTAGLWWLYFTSVAGIAERKLALSDDRTTLARDAYTYLHVVLVAGVVLSAVGDELVLAHPDEPLRSGAEVAAVVGGPALYLLAHTVFRLRLTGSISRRRLAGAVACVLVGVVLSGADALVLAVLVLAVVGGVIVLDQRAAPSEAHAHANA
jgi:low temperature requirement protein LtrA